MNKKIIWWGIGLVILTCTSIITWQSATFKPKTINIGVILPLTGKLAPYAEETKQGIELALINEKNIKVIYEDSQSEPKQGINAFQKLLTNKIPIAITGGSNISLAISPLANQNKILQMAVFSSVADYTSPNDLTFRVTSRSEVENKVLIGWAINHNLKNVAFIYSNDAWGLGHYNFLKSEIEKNNINITAKESFATTETDFHGQLTKIKNSQPEAIFLIAQGKNAGLILKQAKELGLKTQFLGVRAIETNELLAIASEAAENIIYPYSFDSTANNTNIKNFIKKYQTKYNKLPTAYTAEGYDATELLIKATSNCQGTNIACLQNYLTNTKNYSGVLGNISFDYNGDIYLEHFLKTVKDGKFIKY